MQTTESNDATCMIATRVALAVTSEAKAAPRKARRLRPSAFRSSGSDENGVVRAVRTMSPMSQRREPTEADLGWAAGILDGEGCLHIARQTHGDSGRRPNFRMRVQVTQNDELLLKEFEWVVGVSGHLYSTKPTAKQNKACHTLTYDGPRAFAVLERLEPYLRRKKPEAQLAAEYRKACDIHRHTGPKGHPQHVWDLREWYYERMSDLKRA